MSAAKPQPEVSTERQPERHDERIQQRSESTERDATKPSSPPGGPHERPPKLTPSSDATKQASPLGWELSKAAADARASRNRVLWGLLILVIAALGALAAGLVVKEEVFWAATAPVFATAAMALVAYGAERLGVFSQTAELLSRRARAEDSQSHHSSGDRVMRDDAKKIRRESYWEISREIYHQAPGEELEDKPREELRAVLGALSCAARMGHPAASREAALITLHLDGNGSERVRDLLLQASASGYTLAAYNLGGLQGADLPPGEQRDALLAWAHHGAQVAAFIVGAMDASAVDDAQELRPAAVKATRIPRSGWEIVDGAAEAPVPEY